MPDLLLIPLAIPIGIISAFIISYMILGAIKGFPYFIAGMIFSVSFWIFLHII